MQVPLLALGVVPFLTIRIAMPRYVAFLRGVSPVNASMKQLKQCYEDLGFTKVKTVLASGNVVFDAPRMSTSALESRLEKAMQQHLPRSFPTVVRLQEYLVRLLQNDVFGAFEVEAHEKRVVSFFKVLPTQIPALPIEQQGVRILAIVSSEVYTVYRRSSEGPVFMKLLDNYFGKNITTRTWDTLTKCVRA